MAFLQRIIGYLVNEVCMLPVQNFARHPAVRLVRPWPPARSLANAFTLYHPYSKIDMSLQKLF